MKKNYEEYLRAAKETLDRIEYLAPDDRAKIERGIQNMECGHALLTSDDPADLRNAASLLMIGAATIMACCGVSGSEEEYWRRKRCAKGGSKTNPDTEEWQRWVLGKMAKHPDVKATKLANSLSGRKS